MTTAPRRSDALLAALAPMVWGSTYIVATEFLPGFSPMTVAMLRALPAGLLLLLIGRRLPTGIWWLRAFVLGGLNIAFFLTMLFIAAYRLPGGVAATVAASQPLIAVFLARPVLNDAIRPHSVLAAVVGAAGVALLVLAPGAALDPVGVGAGLAGAFAMALGNALTRRWRPPVPMLTATGWQLTAGGLLLVPLVLWAAPPMPAFSVRNGVGLAWLSLIGAALTYVLWFRGVARLQPAAASILLLLSPVTAVLLGWVFLGQSLAPLQVAGGVTVVASIWLGQRAASAPAAGAS